MAAEQSKSGLLHDLAEEFIERHRKGERPSLREYLDKHPALADEIREVFPAMALMENIALPDGSDGRAAAPGAPGSAVSPPLQQLGDFRIIREIGRGGMGVVYEAEQVSLGRHVALKVLPHAALADARHKARFEREAKAAAKLHHTNIVPVFGVGEHDGLPYYAMQFIQGLGLHEVIAELRRMQPGSGPGAPGWSASPGAPGETRTPPYRRWAADRAANAANVARSLLSRRFDATPQVTEDARPNEGSGPREAPTEASLTPVSFLDGSSLSSSSVLFPGQGEPFHQSETGKASYWRSVARIGVQVANALDHAHSQGVLHRDIKPSNLLLDTQGTVWITDFGLAKTTDQDNLTSPGDVLGTFRYMPPERFNGQGDARSDLYSLGLTLYELLTLQPAFNEADRTKLIHQVCHDEPRRPRKLNRGVPRDLETIVLKAIARDPARRYQSAAEMAGDLRRFEEDRPIRARRVSEAERFWRWCRRNPVPAVLAAAVVLLLVIVAVGASVSAVRFRDIAQREQRARADADQALVQIYVANGTRCADDGDQYGALLWFAEALRKEEGDPEREEVHRRRLALVLRQGPQLEQAWARSASSHFASFSPDGRRVLTPDSRSPSRGAARVWDIRTGEPISPPMEHAGDVHKASFSPDGRWVVTAGIDGTARVWDATSGAPITPPCLHGQRVNDVVFSPDGRRFVTASHDKTARVWDAKTGEPITPPLPHEDVVQQASFSPDGQHVATASDDSTAQVWDATTGKRAGPALKHGSQLQGAWFSPDGRQILTASNDRSARLWDSATGQPLARPMMHQGQVYHAAFSPKGDRIVTASHDTTARLWDARTGELMTRPLQHASRVSYAVFSPDGKQVATASEDGVARVWDAVTGEPRTTALRDNSDMRQVHFSADGRRLLTAGATTRIWRLTEGEGRQVLKHAQAIHWAGFSPDGRCVLTASSDRTAQLWDAVTAKPLAAFKHQEAVSQAVFSPDGRRVLTACGDGTARIWDATTGAEVVPALKHQPNVQQAQFSPDGACIVTAGEDGTARLWDAATGSPLGQPMSHKESILAASFSPDGRRIVTASFDGSARVWDAVTGHALTSPLHLGAGYVVYHAVFSPDGRLVATAAGSMQGKEGFARLWDAATGQPLAQPLAQPLGPSFAHNAAYVFRVAFSPDGRRVLTAGSDSTAQVWDAATGDRALPPLRHAAPVQFAAYSSDGRWIVTASWDQTARVWDARTGQPVTPALPHKHHVYHAAFSPDGRRVVTASLDGTAQLWDLSPDPRPVSELVSQAQLLANRRIDSTGGMVRLEVAVARRLWQTLQPRSPRDLVPEGD